jgi:hypothetical protein
VVLVALVLVLLLLLGSHVAGREGRHDPELRQHILLLLLHGYSKVLRRLLAWAVAARRDEHLLLRLELKVWQRHRKHLLLLAELHLVWLLQLGSPCWLQ